MVGIVEHHQVQMRIVCNRRERCKQSLILRGAIREYDAKDNVD
ncbi:MAG: hypothetical protein AB7V21_12705 [Phycisphaerales bacterium]